MTTTTLNVSGMVCGGCASKVTQALEAVEGVTRVEVALEAGHVEIDHADGITPAQLKDTIEALGFDIED